MQCTRCGSDNSNRNTYCDGCGTLLSSSVPYSPEIERNIPLYSEYGMQSQTFLDGKLSSRPRITVFRVIRGILYFIAAPIAAFGLVGTFNGIFGTSNLFEGLAIFFALGLLVGGVVIFLRMRHRIPRLGWFHFIWSILGATVGMVMAFFLAFALLGTHVEFLNLSFGSIVLLYGLVLAVICLW